MLLLLVLSRRPVLPCLTGGAAHTGGVRGARGRPEGYSRAPLVPLAHADGGEGREVVLNCAVDEVAVARVDRREQQGSGTMKTQP